MTRRNGPQRRPGNALGQGDDRYEPPVSPGNCMGQGAGRIRPRIDPTIPPQGAEPFLDDNYDGGVEPARRRLPPSKSGTY
jgi:hypothetical protein